MLPRTVLCFYNRGSSYYLLASIASNETQHSEQMIAGSVLKLDVVAVSAKCLREGWHSVGFQRSSLPTLRGHKVLQGSDRLLEGSRGQYMDKGAVVSLRQRRKSENATDDCDFASSGLPQTWPTPKKNTKQSSTKTFGRAPLQLKTSGAAASVGNQPRPLHAPTSATSTNKQIQAT